MFCRLLVALFAPVCLSAAFLRRSQAPQCRISSFPKQGTIVVSEKNTLFKSGNVLVVKDGSRRVLVTDERAAQTGDNTYVELAPEACRAKADVQCVYEQKIAPPEGRVPRHMPKKTSSSCGDAADCEAEMTPQLTISQSLIGGAVTARGGLKKLRQVLVAGIGAGAVPRWFAHYLPQTSLVEAIDSSADIVAAAPCFGMYAGKKLRLVHSTTKEHIKSCQNGTYDAVILDNFLAASTERCLSTPDFFNRVRSKMTSQGILLVNTDPDTAELVASAMKQAFGNVERGYAPGLGNVILRSQERPRPKEENLPEGNYGLDVSDDDSLSQLSRKTTRIGASWPQGAGWGGRGLESPSDINLAEDKAVEWSSAANFELLELPEDTEDEDAKRDQRFAKDASC